MAAPTSLAAHPSNPCQRRAVYTWLMSRCPPRCPARPLTEGMRPFEPRMFAYRRFRQLRLQQQTWRTGGLEAVPDPEPKCNRDRTRTDKVGFWFSIGSRYLAAGSRGALPRLTVTRQHLRSAGHSVAERLIETDAADLPSVRPARRCEVPVGDPAERLLAPNHAAE
jgi:hypothetical protein